MPFVRPSIVHEVPVTGDGVQPLTAEPPDDAAHADAWYDAIVLPPESEGVAQDTERMPSPPCTVTGVGGDGFPTGVPATRADGSDVPVAPPTVAEPTTAT